MIYYIIQDISTGVFYNVENSQLNELDGVSEITAEIIQTYGNTEIPSGELLLELQKPKLYAWQSDEESTLPTITATLNAIPLPQTIITNEIDLSNATITGIENVITEYTGTPVFAVSFDSGVTWEMHNGTDWVVLSGENTGMQAGTFEAITSEQWQERIEGLDSILVRFSLLSSEDSVISVTINFTN